MVANAAAGGAAAPAPAKFKWGADMKNLVSLDVAVGQPSASGGYAQQRHSSWEGACPSQPISVHLCVLLQPCRKHCMQQPSMCAMDVSVRVSAAL